jgi:hypothetical protein
MNKVGIHTCKSEKDQVTTLKKIWVHAKNLRWHPKKSQVTSWPQNHFEGSRLNRQELCYADCLIYKWSGEPSPIISV